MAREYTAALLVEINRKECVQSDPRRAVELAAYFTHFKLQNVWAIQNVQNRSHFLAGVDVFTLYGRPGDQG